MTQALFVIAGEYIEAAKKLADLDLDEQTVADTLEGMSGALEVKARNVACFIRNLEVTAEAIKAFEAEQKDRRQAIEKRAERMRAYLQSCMEATGIQRIEGPGVVLSFRKSSAVAIHEPGLIPAEFMRVPEPPPPTPDKVAISAAIKAGRAVPGAHIETRQHLQIR